MQLIRLADAPNQELTTSLNAQTVRLIMDWAPLYAVWNLSLYWASDNAPIAVSRQVALRSKIIGTNQASFIGDLVALPPTGLTIYPNVDAWGKGYRLVYLTPVEVQTFVL